MITRKEAQNLITEIRDDEFNHGRKPETWFTYHNHVYGTAVLSEFIAKKLNMDAEKCYIMGLLHDIGKIYGDREKRFHGVVGYEKGIKIDPLVARTSMLHTFPFNKIPSDDKLENFFFGNQKDYDFTHQYVKNTAYDDYDLLIQLTDNMAYIRGFLTLEERIIDWCKRNNRPYLPEHIDPLNELRIYFEKKLKQSIYDLFKEIDMSYLID